MIITLMETCVVWFLNTLGGVSMIDLTFNGGSAARRKLAEAEVLALSDNVWNIFRRGESAEFG